jgi:hypothetical protein
MKNLLRPLRSLFAIKTVAAVAVISVAVGSAVGATVKHHRKKRRTPPVAMISVSGGLRGHLSPGGLQPIDVAFGNRTRSQVWITSLRVTAAVDPAHVAAGCSIDRDFALAQVPATALPIRLPARSVFRPGWPARFRWPTPRMWLLSELGVRTPPTISMVNLTQVNQDACKGATLHFSFQATVRRKRPR